MIPSSVYFSIINFVLFVGVMVVVLRKPLRAFLQTRQSSFEQVLQESQRARKEAEARLDGYEKRVASLESEVATLKATAKEEGKKEREAIIAQAREYATKMAGDTERMIAQDIRRSKEMLKGTTIDLAIILAERMLREQLTPTEHAKLIKGYIQQLEQLN